MPTRISDRSATLIDHIYYFDYDKHYDVLSGNIWCDITDHLPNFLLLKNSEVQKNNANHLPFVRLYSGKNIEKFKNLVADIDWTPLYNHGNANDAYAFFHNKLIDCHNKCFSLVKLSRKCARDKLWITRGIKRSSNRKNKLYKKWLCSHNPDDQVRYKNYLKIFKKVTLEARTAYYREKFDTRTNTVKQLWTNLNKISSLGKTRTATTIDKLTFNNKDITDPKDICNELNKYFCSVGETLSQSLKPCGQFDFKKYNPQPCRHSMFCSPVTPEEVLKIIQNFPSNKSPGPDNMKSNIVKEICNNILDPLAHVYNLSFSTGLVPDLLKVSKVIPVYKKR